MGFKMKLFNKINRRLAKLGSTVTVLASAGRDAERHQLVTVSCDRCGVGTEFRSDPPKVMRLGNITRKVKTRRGKKISPPMSCGCLQHDVHQIYLNSRKRSGALRKGMLVRRSYFDLYDDRTEGFLVCLLARKGFEPSVPRRELGLMWTSAAGTFYRADHFGAWNKSRRNKEDDVADAKQWNDAHPLPASFPIAAQHVQEEIEKYKKAGGRKAYCAIENIEAGIQHFLHPPPEEHEGIHTPWSEQEILAQRQAQTDGSARCAELRRYRLGNSLIEKAGIADVIVPKVGAYFMED